MNDKLKNILEWIYCIIIAVVIAILIKYFVGTPTIVKQTSMWPTLEQNDRLILNRLPRTFGEMPERGDIITFEAPSNNATGLTAEEIDNPIAKYDNEPTTWWRKFTYHVLEIGKESYIKRVIALPGEHVEIKDGKVYINGEELDEPYLTDDVITEPTGVLNDVIVPENTVFAMGDNREGSKDCRAFGCIPFERIESKVVIRFWPLNKFGKVE
mgnify:FL=1